MGCIAILFALISPRLALFVMWLFTTLIDRAYDSFVIPVLGFVFLPWTTLAYALAYDGREVSAVGWLFVAVALVVDVSSWGASSRR